MSAPRKIVYLDYASTTPVDARVAAAMAEALTAEGAFGNPSSTHAFGAAARAAVERARVQVAGLIGAQAGEIVWTSSATEANNLAILGVARHALRARRALRQDPSRVHLITARTEHKSVLGPCKQLEREGCSVTYLEPQPDGRIDPRQVEQALQSQTALVSIMHVNNEIGTINDVAAIGCVCRARGVAFHVDAAQSAGKIPIDVESMSIDLLSLSAHKIHGPKGAGALYVRREPPLGLEPVLFGGGQEGGLRSGTLATHQIVGMGLACEIAASAAGSGAQRFAALRERLWRGLQALGNVLPNPAVASPALVPQILNVSFDGVHGESLLAGLDDLAVSSGSTCNSATREPSYVLRALGRSDAQAEASLRFSLGRDTTPEDIDYAIAAVARVVRRLRDLSPAAGAPADACGFAVGEAGSMHQGTWIRWLLKIDSGRIAEARYQAYGCPHTLAACEWLHRHLPGRAATTNSVLPEGAAGLAAAVGAPPEKLGRLLIIEDALRAACAAGC